MAAVGLSLGEQLAHANTECRSERPKCPDADLTLRALDSADNGAVQAGRVCELLLAKAGEMPYA